VSSLVKEGRPMPTKLSEWLRVAVEDARRLPEQCSTPELKFTADMSTWANSNDGTCHACLAGSALIGTGLWNPTELHSFADDPIALALNELRGGNVDGALEATADWRRSTPRVERAAERVFVEAWDAHIASDPDGNYESYSREDALDELGSAPSPGARASDEAYLELADALAEMGL
jgi:hypothetical protein